MIEIILLLGFAFCKYLPRPRCNGFSVNECSNYAGCEFTESCEISSESCYNHDAIEVDCITDIKCVYVHDVFQCWYFGEYETAKDDGFLEDDKKIDMIGFIKNLAIYAGVVVVVIVLIIVGCLICIFCRKRCKAKNKDGDEVDDLYFEKDDDVSMVPVYTHVEDSYFEKEFTPKINDGKTKLHTEFPEGEHPEPLSTDYHPLTAIAKVELPAIQHRLDK